MKKIKREREDKRERRENWFFEKRKRMSSQKPQTSLRSSRIYLGDFNLKKEKEKEEKERGEKKEKERKEREREEEEMVKNGIEILEKAVAADNAHDFEAAISFYRSALSTLQVWIHFFFFENLI